MNLFDYINEQTVRFDVEVSGWKDAIAYAGSLLEEEGYIEHRYTEDMISLVESLGAYIVVMPGVALAHARPEGHVRKNSIAIITLKEGVDFGHEMNDRAVGVEFLRRVTAVICKLFDKVLVPLTKLVLRTIFDGQRFRAEMLDQVFQ